MPDKDILRLRTEYARRRESAQYRGLYSLSYPAYLFMIQQRERRLIECLTANRFQNMQKKRLLEVGCGYGGVLLDLKRYSPNDIELFGVELLFDRLLAGQQHVPFSFTNADGQALPFGTGEFDIVTQFGALSSVLDPAIKHKMAAEMLRVVNRDGLIIWYDFWWNPKNKETQGIKPKEIRLLFPDCQINLKKITLAPPIARKIVPISWPLALILESLKIFNSHYLVLITKQSK